MSRLKPTTGFVNVGELFVCNCGIPLAKNMGEKGYELIKFYDGKQVKIQVEFGDMLKVHCPTCGRGFAHLVVRESLDISDSSTAVIAPDTLS